MKKITQEDVEPLLDLDNEEIQSDYESWDKGDCSVHGLIIILLKQSIKQVDHNGVYDNLLKAVNGLNKLY